MTITNGVSIAGLLLTAALVVLEFKTKWVRRRIWRGRTDHECVPVVYGLPDWLCAAYFKHWPQLMELAELRAGNAGIARLAVIDAFARLAVGWHHEQKRPYWVYRWLLAASYEFIDVYHRQLAEGLGAHPSRGSGLAGF